MGFVLGLGLAVAVGLGLQFGGGIFSPNPAVLHLISIAVPVINIILHVKHLQANYYLRCATDTILCLVLSL